MPGRALLAPPEEVLDRLVNRVLVGDLRERDPVVLSDLAYLNQVYEEKFGFRFVAFVAGRPKREILEVLRERIGRTRAEELDTGCRELVAIARDRWTRT